MEIKDILTKSLVFAVLFVYIMSLGSFAVAYQDEEVQEQKRADLIVLGFEGVDFNNVKEGDSLNLYALVKNQGKSESGGFNIRSTFDDNENFGYGSHPNIAPGEVVRIEMPNFLNVKVTRGKHTISYAVDVDNFISEPDEGNNVYKQSFVVGSSTVTGGPDLTVDGFKITNMALEPVTPVAGRGFVVVADVRNIGDRASEPSNIKWYRNGVQVGYGSFGPVPANADEATYSHNNKFVLNEKAGAVTIGYMADADNHNSESNENNNYFEQTIYVKESEEIKEKTSTSPGKPSTKPSVIPSAKPLVVLDVHYAKTNKPDDLPRDGGWGPGAYYLVVPEGGSKEDANTWQGKSIGYLTGFGENQRYAHFPYGGISGDKATEALAFHFDAIPGRVYNPQMVTIKYSRECEEFKEGCDENQLNVFLPAIKPGKDGQAVEVWVATDGSTYYADTNKDGTGRFLSPEEAMNTANIARQSEMIEEKTEASTSPDFVADSTPFAVKITPEEQAVQAGMKARYKVIVSDKTTLLTTRTSVYKVSVNGLDQDKFNVDFPEKIEIKSGEIGTFEVVVNSKTDKCIVNAETGTIECPTEARPEEAIIMPEKGNLQEAERADGAAREEKRSDEKLTGAATSDGNGDAGTSADGSAGGAGAGSDGDGSNPETVDQPKPKEVKENGLIPQGSETTNGDGQEGIIRKFVGKILQPKQREELNEDKEKEQPDKIIAAESASASNRGAVKYAKRGTYEFVVEVEEVISSRKAKDTAAIKIIYKGEPTTSPEEVPDFPYEGDYESATMSLNNGWNLIALPGDFAGIGSDKKDGKKPVAFVYLKEEKRFVPMEEAEKILGPELKKYLATTAIWIYSYDDRKIEMKLKGYTSANEVGLVQGWTPVPLYTKDFTGRTFKEIAGNCDVEAAYTWNAEVQKWNAIEPSYKITDSDMFRGVIVKSNNKCSFGEFGVLTPPSMPDEASASADGAASN